MGSILLKSSTYFLTMSVKLSRSAQYVEHLFMYTADVREYVLLEV